MTGGESGGNEPQNSGRHHPEKTIVKAFVTIAIIVILGYFLASFAMKLVREGPKEGNVVDYNGFRFEKTGLTWRTQWERDGLLYDLQFRHSPWEVENITVLGKVDERFQMPYLFITHDPPDNVPTRQNSFLFIASADITSMLVSVFDRHPVEACTVNSTEECSKLPVATCSTNATVIYLKASDDAGILLDGNCATIQGREENLTRAANKAVYQWLGIIR